jgi:tetratricopeptide (TPR) repeat protein
MRELGYTLFKLDKPKEALAYIRNALEIAPNDKESLFTLADCYCEAGQKDQAAKIYSHLRADAVWGPRACLASGMLHVNAYQDEDAITDFEIGTKHQNIEMDTECELKYQLALAYIRQQDIGNGMRCLHEIMEIRDDYKNVADLIDQYKELNSSRNMQIFVLAPVAEFVALCRKIVMTYFGVRAKVKITQTQMQGNEWVDIVAEVNTIKWQDTVMFRFIRTQGAIGELVVRDFHSHLKDAKASKGICAALGVFSEEAKHYTDSRLIDLLEKDKLMALLNIVDEKIQTQAAAAKAKQKVSQTVRDESFD